MHLSLKKSGTSPDAVLKALAVAVVFLPGIASAMTSVQFFGFLNILVGLFLTLAIILYGAGVIVYFTRYGTPHRMESLTLIEVALSILFILIIILGVVQYFQQHPGNMAYIIGTVIFVLVVGFIIYAYSGGGEKKAGPPGR